MFFFSDEFQTVVSALNEGFIKTVQLFFLTLIGALPLGLIISFGSMNRFAPLRWLTRTVVWIIRGTPLVLQILIIYFGPGLLNLAFGWGGGSSGRMTAAVVAKSTKSEFIKAGDLLKKEDSVEFVEDFLTILAQAGMLEMLPSSEAEQ